MMDGCMDHTDEECYQDLFLDYGVDPYGMRGSINRSNTGLI